MDLILFEMVVVAQAATGDFLIALLKEAEDKAAQNCVAILRCTAETAAILHKALGSALKDPLPQ